MTEQNELDQKIWAVIGSHEVVCINFTYDQCIKIRNAKDPTGNNLTITTSAAAQRFTQKENAQ